MFNIGEPVVRSIRGWAEEILTAAGTPAELVTVPDAVTPEDMWITRSVAQHVVFDGYKAAQAAGLAARRPGRALATSVRWHLAHPPPDASDDFTADDTALAAVAT